MDPQLINGSLGGSVACVSPRGPADASFFLKFLEHPIYCSHVTRDKHTPLVRDGRDGHNTLEATELAEVKEGAAHCPTTSTAQTAGA